MGTLYTRRNAAGRIKTKRIYVNDRSSEKLSIFHYTPHAFICKVFFQLFIRNELFFLRLYCIIFLTNNVKAYTAICVYDIDYGYY